MRWRTSTYLAPSAGTGSASRRTTLVDGSAPGAHRCGMNVSDKVVVVTGGGSGIGRAMVQRFAKEGARHVAVVDLDREAAEAVATSVGGTAFRADVTREDEIRRVVLATESQFGPIDLFCSNAGVLVIDADRHNAASASDADWARAWSVNVMSHVHAARVLLPGMIERGKGYFLQTVSAAGLLSQIAAAPYSTTKHAAIGFAESLAITHKDHGIKVSVLCPQGVQTPMIEGKPMLGADIDGVVSADDVAGCVIEGLAKEVFLILPHPNVATYMAKKVESYDRWLGGMSKLRRGLVGE